MKRKPGIKVCFRIQRVHLQHGWRKGLLGEPYVSPHHISNWKIMGPKGYYEALTEETYAAAAAGTLDVFALVRNPMTRLLSGYLVGR